MELRANMGKKISSAVRGERMDESHRLFERALEAYSLLRDDLSQRDVESMTAQEKAVLRNAQFAIGYTCFARA